MKSMTKRLFSILLVLCMMLSVMPVAAFAADTAGTETTSAGTVAEEPKADEPKTEESKKEETQEKTNEDSEIALLKGGHGDGGHGGSVWEDTKWFGYDSWFKGGDLSGVKSVTVGSTTLERNSTSVTADEAVKNGVRITFNEGWYLERWKVVCGDKYGCQTDAWGRATTATGVMTGAGAVYHDVGITDNMMNHDNNSNTYWLLLELKQDNKNYTVSYNWGALTGKLNSSVPAGGSYKVNAVVPVAVPSDAAVAEARALGYEFDGWTMSYGDKSSDVAGGSSFAMPQANVTLTAKWKTATTSFTVTKVWEDNNNSAQKRPDSITVLLRRNGADYTTAELNAANNWTHTWNDLPKMVDGAAVSYTADELTVPQGYTKDATYVGNSCIITNTYIGDTIDIKITKIWDDNSNQDGKRPQFIKINLLADGVVDKSIEISTYSVNNTNMVGFNRRPVYNGDGKKIEYTVGEETVPAGYQATVTGSAEEGFTITNTHVPEKITISGSKRWDDHDDQDGKRPNSITVNLLADGEKVDSKVVTAANGWEWSFEADKYKGGKEITYTITEDTVEGYTSSVTGDQAMGFTITNTHVPEKITISGSKTWDDHDDQDGKRPDSIAVNLLADGVKVDSKVVTADDGWKWSFEGVAKYSKGKEIKYTITEDAVEGYTSKVEGYNVTNTHTPETINITGSKTWDDQDDQDGKRPGSITVNLLADGEKVDSKVVTADDGWKWSFEGAAKYSKGKEIKYTITEDAVEGYTSKVEGYNVTNTHTPATTTVNVTKKWTDNNNKAGARPKSVTIYLLADGEKTGDELVLSADNKWTGSFENVPVNKNGKAIKYTVSEKTVSKYKAKITGSAEMGFVVTNTHTSIPTTGDQSNMTMYMMLFALGAAAVVTALILGKKKNGGYGGKYVRHG